MLICPDTTSFVDTLLSALRTKQYIPYVSPSTPPPQTAPARSPRDGAIPIPLDSIVSTSSQQSRGRKRGFDDRDEEHRDRQKPKTPRVHSSNIASRSTSTQAWSQSDSVPRDIHPPSPADQLWHKSSERMDIDASVPVASTKPICRDYHRKFILAVNSTI